MLFTGLVDKISLLLPSNSAKLSLCSGWVMYDALSDKVVSNVSWLTGYLSVNDCTKPKDILHFYSFVVFQIRWLVR